MKKYDIKIQNVKENIISVNATSRRGALKKVKKIIKNSRIHDVDINGITKNYISLYIEKII
ncbi:MAG: hypothetical protein E7162_01730 [Firmicutes bacterium]|nr:hypothetical protein [Bacillota bacterium]